MQETTFNLTLASRFAQLAIDCIHRKYPHVHRYFLKNEQDLIIPHQLHPVFYGCLDWHSAVHNHWMLIRLIRLFPDATFSSIAREAIATHFTADKISQEIAYLKSHPQFECPYGLAWLLQLVAELIEWNDSQAKQWSNYLQPLENIVANNIQKWLEILSYPDRTGTHQQTAFSLGLIWDWASLKQNKLILDLIINFAQTFYLTDKNYPWFLEPLGYDFLSPTLAEADLIRRILPSEAFAEWLDDFLPKLSLEPNTEWFQPVKANNPEDYHHSHLEGLNLSRAWMLDGIIAALPQQDNRIRGLQTIADLHRQAGLNPLSTQEYSGSHWLGSFAIYLATNRGFSGNINSV
ncbi:MAG: DUF2891 domain-containing protein [Microcoleaceae cyanobacterium]